MNSIMNDEDLQMFGALLITEPNAWRSEGGKVLTTPMAHHNWNKIMPTTMTEERWAYRSMMWVWTDLEAEQIIIDSPDIAAALISLPQAKILVISVYVLCGDQEALLRIVELISTAAREVWNKKGEVELIITGDFNCHDPLWGGDNIAEERLGEGTPIIDIMAELSLISLLLRGTITWEKDAQKTTIDLVLTTEKLVDTRLCCKIYNTDHGSDHKAIETVFNLEIPKPVRAERLLFKEALWGEIRAEIAGKLKDTPPMGTQAQCDRLMAVVTEVTQCLVPKARPLLYAKR